MNITLLAVASPVNDLFDSARYVGAMSSINWLTDFIDRWFVMAITLAAFTIISVAILKNVLAGTYCAFPKFWDRVDIAHQDNADKGWVERITGLKTSYQKINLGTIQNFIFGLIPNIKPITDFEGDTVAPKDYFLRAIPMMLAVVIIGAFIYNGYYRDTAMKVSNIGAEVFNRLVLNTDLVKMYDKFMNTSGKPTFATSESKEDKYVLANEIAEKAYSEIITKYTDIKEKSVKSTMANNLETWAIDFAGAHAEYVNSDQYKWSVNVTLTLGSPDLSKIDYVSPNGERAQFGVAKACSEVGFDSAEAVGEDWYVRAVILFTKKAASQPSGYVQDLVLTVPASAWTQDSRTSTTTISVPASTEYYIMGMSCTIDGKSVNISSDHKSIVVQGALPNGEYDCNLKYASGSSTHTITKIKVNSSVTRATLSSASGAINETTVGSEVVRTKQDNN